MTFYQIRLVRVGEQPVDLGTVPNEDDLEAWFSGAFAAGLLPDPPKYTDEIQVFEVAVGEKTHRQDSEPRQSETLKWIWRLSWHQFEAARIHLV